MSATHYDSDTPEQIQMCLNCKRPECNDCIAYNHAPKEQRKVAPLFHREAGEYTTDTEAL